MKWTDSSGLPLDKCKVGIELPREIEDEETGEVIEEQVIDVTVTFWPAEPNVGLGPGVEVITAHRSDTKEREPVELDDWEVDSLINLLQEQRRT